MNAKNGKKIEIVHGLKLANSKRQALYSWIAVAAIMVLALLFYVHSLKGINIDFDDFTYAYFSEFPRAILRNYVFSGSFGMVAVGRFFYLVIGSSLSLVTVAGITGVLLTILTIFLIGREYDKPAVGLVAATLYAFNPMIYTYAPHLLPEDFIPLLLAISILLLLKAEKHNGSRKAVLKSLSGFVLGLSLFLGVQGFIIIIAYIAMVLLASYTAKEGIKPVVFAIAGVIIAATLLSLVQLCIYNAPFKGVTNISHDLSVPGRYVQAFYITYI